MRFDEVAAIVGDVPHTSPHWGRKLYNHVLRTEACDILELGFAHGTSTCYLAAALDELGRGMVTSIDLPAARERRPSIYDLLDRTGLTRYVQPVVTDTSYLWELKRLIEARSSGGSCEPIFDFCFIDGAHTWDTDGFAFFLVDKLLRSGGWILFDDLDWSYASSPTLRDADWVQHLPEEQRLAHQVRAVYDLLVRQHPRYDSFREDQGWGWARKHRYPPPVRRAYRLAKQARRWLAPRSA